MISLTKLTALALCAIFIPTLAAPYVDTYDYPASPSPIPSAVPTPDVGPAFKPAPTPYVPGPNPEELDMGEPEEKSPSDRPDETVAPYPESTDEEPPFFTEDPSVSPDVPEYTPEETPYDDREYPQESPDIIVDPIYTPNTSESPEPVVDPIYTSAPSATPIVSESPYYTPKVAPSPHGDKAAYDHPACYFENVIFESGTAVKCCERRFGCEQPECADSQACKSNPDVCFCRKRVCKKVYLLASYKPITEIDSSCVKDVFPIAQ